MLSRPWRSVFAIQTSSSKNLPGRRALYSPRLGGMVLKDGHRGDFPRQRNGFTVKA